MAEEPGGRFDWRPSRWLVGALMLLGVLAGGSVLASDLDTRVAIPAAAVAAAWGVLLARREARRPPCVVRVHSGGERIDVDGDAVEAFAVAWRGPLAFARWRDDRGRSRRRVWWPDTLSSAARRELRLALPVESPPRPAQSVAP